MKTLPTETELREGFNDFAKFTLELIEKVSPSSQYLKFAAVNSQIALELFLKYYFTKKDKVAEIQKKKGDQLVNDFNEFSQILSYFYSSSTKTWPYGKKKEFLKLLNSRNDIVHRAQSSNWNEELAEHVVRTLFFIHGTAWDEFGETVLFNNFIPHKIANNPIWRTAAEKFALDINTEIYRCLSCNAKAVINAELMVLDEYDSVDDLICLCCLSSIDTEYQATLMKCYECRKKSYYVDTLNEQEKQLYVGKCAECGTNTLVRKCKQCEEYYHPSASNEVNKDENYFCSEECCEMYYE